MKVSFNQLPPVLQQALADALVKMAAEQEWSTTQLIQAVNQVHSVQYDAPTKVWDK